MTIVRKCVYDVIIELKWWLRKWKNKWNEYKKSNLKETTIRWMENVFINLFSFFKEKKEEMKIH